MIDCLTKFRSLVRVPVVVLGLSIVTSGCGGSASNSKITAKPRVTATGKVEVDGSPVAAGTVSFINKDSGNTASCAISNGTFSCKAADGPNPGENAVVIVAREKPDGEDVWTWSSKADVGASGYSGDFTVKAKETKPARKRVVDN